ncbi:GNAT family N-acetyltransferase [Promethearchaeum syntrophicum]|uniref:GNAT family N-acetyltransferase n=1 Tax=Promethearchaeum syntrophicum TaxID=2594042 RepID=A0A5B9D7V5_9ARCH|nr:GNAT family protein [Candidatus Prometheoarchaeum syntrophicum]
MVKKIKKREEDKNQFIIETERLILRNIDLKDTETFLEYRNDPLVAKYQSWEPPLIREQVSDFINNLQTHKIGEPGKWNQIVWILKKNLVHIGDCALKVQEDTMQAELGFTLSRNYQGKGYAYEATRALINYAFEELGLHRIFSITDCKNTTAIKLLKSLGMRQEGHFIENIFFKGAWGDEFLYAILQKEWNYP